MSLIFTRLKANCEFLNCAQLNGTREICFNIHDFYDCTTNNNTVYFLKMKKLRSKSSLLVESFLVIQMHSDHTWGGTCPCPLSVQFLWGKFGQIKGWHSNQRLPSSLPPALKILDPPLDHHQ